MADDAKTVRSSSGSRGGVRRERGSAIGAVAAGAAAPVVDLLARLGPEELNLSARCREKLKPALEGRGYTLRDEKLPYNDTSPKCTVADGPTPFFLMHIHPDLLPDAPGQSLPHDFSHLGFCVWKHGGHPLRIVSEDNEFLPVEFVRWFRTWQDTVDVDAQFVGWSRVEAVANANDPAEALALYLSLDIASAPAGDDGTGDDESAAVAAPVVPLAAQPEPPPQPGVFISYSHADDPKWIGALRQYVKEPLERLNYEVWDDSDIEPGDRWRDQIDSALARARIVVLMVSQNFENSDFIQDNELRPALEAAEGGVKVLPVAVSRVAWEVDPLRSLLGGYQWVYGPPTDERPPLDELDDAVLRRALIDIRIKIQRALEDGDDAADGQT